MKKKVTIILIIISILLLGFGLSVCGQIRNEVGNGLDPMKVFTISFFLEIVGGIWAIYGIIILFIKSIMNKYKKH